MRRIIDHVYSLRLQLEKYGDWLEQYNSSIPNAFNMIFNDLTLTLELLDYYYRVWSSLDVSAFSAEDVERRRKENWKRVMQITKWAFIDALSSLEFSLKKMLETINPKVLSVIKERRRNKPIYLRSIIKELHREGYVNDEAYNGWITLIEIRNCVVHNNAIPESNRTLYLNGLKIVFTRGQMLTAKLDFFIKLIDYAIKNYKRLVEALIEDRSSIKR